MLGMKTEIVRGAYQQPGRIFVTGETVVETASGHLAGKALVVSGVIRVDPKRSTARESIVT